MSKILLVEDEVDIRNVLIKRFRKRNLDVVTTDDGEKVAAMVLSERPDVILMDIRLEKSGSVIDGLEATRRLKGDPATCSVPVIALTADLVGDRPQQCLDAGCNDYETKPIDFPRLLEKIHSHLQKVDTP